MIKTFGIVCLFIFSGFSYADCNPKNLFSCHEVKNAQRKEVCFKKDLTKYKKTTLEKHCRSSEKKRKIAKNSKKRLKKTKKKVNQKQQL